MAAFHGMEVSVMLASEHSRMHEQSYLRSFVVFVFAQAACLDIVSAVQGRTSSCLVHLVHVHMYTHACLHTSVAKGFAHTIVHIRLRHWCLKGRRFGRWRAASSH